MNTNEKLFFNSSGQVLLHLPQSKYRNKLSIGFLTDRTLIIQKQRHKHYLKMYAGFSFNYNLIAYENDKFDLVNLVVDGVNLFATPQVIMSMGKMLNFDELQICLPEKYFSRSRGEASAKRIEVERAKNISYRIADIPETQTRLEFA